MVLVWDGEDDKHIFGTAFQSAKLAEDPYYPPSCSRHTPGEFSVGFRLKSDLEWTFSQSDSSTHIPAPQLWQLTPTPLPFWISSFLRRAAPALPSLGIICQFFQATIILQVLNFVTFCAVNCIVPGLGLLVTLCICFYFRFKIFWTSWTP